jgi:hypothetical protein
VVTISIVVTKNRNNTISIKLASIATLATRVQHQWYLVQWPSPRFVTIVINRAMSKRSATNLKQTRLGVNKARIGAVEMEEMDVVEAEDALAEI